MESLGAMLRGARLARGRELTDLADEIKVHPRYLEALEADDLKSLPGGFFYKSFVRQYASALGIEMSRVERALSEAPVEEAPIPTAPSVEQPILKDIRPMPTRAKRDYTGLLQVNGLFSSVGVLILVMVTCGGFYVWWHRLQTAPPSEKGERRVSRVLPPQVSTPPPPTPPAPAAQPDQPPPAEAAPAPDQTRPEPPATAAEGPVKLTLTAREDAWVHIWADGTSTYVGVIKAGETKSFTASASARLRTGNASGLAISWNGKPVEFPSGPRVFIRDLSFTPSAWQPTPGASTQPTQKSPTAPPTDKE